MTKPAPHELIPHRAPFLFVDEIVELNDRRIATRVLADPQAAFFKGHYPHNPVMPGVLLCECCFQAGAMLVAGRLGKPEAPTGTPVITRIKEAKFKRLVKPGEMLDVEITLEEELNDVYFMTGRLRVQGTLALRVEFAATRIGGQ